MELVTYRKTLDVHKSGVQFTLQGFQTADTMSRVIEISLMASGDAIDFPLEGLEAMMYVTTEGVGTSINECTIKDNKIIYECLPIESEGITHMCLKLLDTDSTQRRILVSPEFAVEVAKSGADETDALASPSFSALEKAMMNAKMAYDGRFLRMELAEDGTFRAYYADGTMYETDVLKRIFNDGNTLLSESYAKGGTGIRAGEDTDNSMYYCKVAESEALKAKEAMANSEEVLTEIRKNGTYTAFAVDFTTGHLEYVSPRYTFKINPETGHLDVVGKEYTFKSEIGTVVEEWLAERGMALDDLSNISKEHSEKLKNIDNALESHNASINTINEELTKVTPYSLGGTNASSLDGAKSNLGVSDLENLLYWNTYGKLKKLGGSDVSVYGIYKNTQKIAYADVTMINSGKITVDFGLVSNNYLACKAGTQSTAGVRLKISLIRNNVAHEILKKFATLTLIGNDATAGVIREYIYLFTLSTTQEIEVKRGDIIRFEVFASTDENSYMSNGGSVLTNFNIYANSNTPIVYDNFSNYITKGGTE